MRRSSRCSQTIALCALLFVKSSLAEKVLLKNADGEVFTDGRVGAFLSYVRGDGLLKTAVDANGVPTHDVLGGGFEALGERPLDSNGVPTQGTIESMRIRSGFVGNVLGFGVRAPFGDNKVTAYMQLWSYVESDGRRKALPNPVDVRQGYGKVEGPWGSFLMGKSRALFSRGATDINVLYAHRFGLGNPSSIDGYGPTAGHVGYGVLGSGFAAGLVYATPVLAGLQLTVGAFDPIQLNGAWTRTKWVRPEAELTFEQSFGTSGKVVLFGNGAYQKVYKADVTESDTAAGFGYGGRFEFGIFHLGVAGHYGKGLGLRYALEASDATLDVLGNMRKFDGYYVQSQFVLGKFDLSAGWGITRVFLNDADNVRGANGQFAHSVIKRQIGMSGVVVYHLTPAIHLDLDYFRADAAWYLGEQQIIHALNTGGTVTW